MMKMIGLKMRNYWVVYILFNLIYFAISALIFTLFGILATNLSLFHETNLWILVVTLIGWGISQIGLATLLQVFIHKARTAIILGYLASLWVMIVAASVNLLLYSFPEKLPLFWRLVPHFAFQRVFYRLANGCANFECIKSFEELGSEVRECIMLSLIHI
eukprot:TRINITY_DN14565_c0_g1_i2.p1 TRINITY_DN14565_c0_g1~~TRINITY_DN14565_c0_g1_i2.p1  ORF type:complete len:160 (-),score=16.30 TRINITY_DN14565_c0_g1_i2:62-541(-)